MFAKNSANLHSIPRPAKKRRQSVALGDQELKKSGEDDKIPQG